MHLSLLFFVARRQRVYVEALFGIDVAVGLWEFVSSAITKDDLDINRLPNFAWGRNDDHLGVSFESKKAGLLVTKVDLDANVATLLKAIAMNGDVASAISGARFGGDGFDLQTLLLVTGHGADCQAEKGGQQKNSF